MSASGWESTSPGRLHQSSLIWTWKENLKLIDHWTSSGRAAETSGRMQVGTEASRYSEGSGRKYTSSGRMMLDLSGILTEWHVVQTDGTVDTWASRRDDTSSGRLTRNRFFWLVTSAESLKYFWIVDSLWRASLHTSDFVQSEWSQSQTNKLPLWPFWDKYHLTGLEIHSRSKKKITPPFCHKRTKGKIE
jgi:hypothetical protein